MPQLPAVYSAHGFTGGKALITNSAVDIQAGQTIVNAVDTAYNTNSNDCFLLLYNAKAANVQVGTTIPTKIIAIPKSTKYQQAFDNGIYFSIALSVALVMTSQTGNTVATTPFGIDIHYQ